MEKHLQDALTKVFNDTIAINMQKERIVDSSWTENVKFENEIWDLKDKLKKARAKIRMQNKIIKALTK